MKKIYRVQITHMRGGACVWDAEHEARSRADAIREAFREAGIDKEDKWRFDVWAERI